MIPQPGIESLLAALQQGGKPQGSLGTRPAPILQGAPAGFDTISGATPAALNEISSIGQVPFLNSLRLTRQTSPLVAKAFGS